VTNQHRIVERKRRRRTRAVARMLPKMLEIRQRRRHSKAVVEKVHVLDKELSDSFNSEKNDSTYECEEANHNEDHAEGKEEATIHQSVKAA